MTDRYLALAGEKGGLRRRHPDRGPRDRGRPCSFYPVPCQVATATLPGPGSGRAVAEGSSEGIVHGFPEPQAHPPLPSRRPTRRHPGRTRAVRPDGPPARGGRQDHHQTRTSAGSRSYASSPARCAPTRGSTCRGTSRSTAVTRRKSYHDVDGARRCAVEPARRGTLRTVPSTPWPATSSPSRTSVTPRPETPCRTRTLRC